MSKELTVKQLLNSQVVTFVRKLLGERCRSQGVAKRSEILADLQRQFGLNDADAEETSQLLKVAVDMGVFDSGDTQYGNFKGRYGGIRAVDVEAERHAEEVHAKRAANAAKAREVRMAKVREAHSHSAEVKVKRALNAAKARAALAAKRAA